MNNLNNNYYILFDNIVSNYGFEKSKSLLQEIINNCKTKITNFNNEIATKETDINIDKNDITNINKKLNKQNLIILQQTDNKKKEEEEQQFQKIYLEFIDMNKKIDE